jgi:putative membrane protein
LRRDAPPARLTIGMLLRLVVRLVLLALVIEGIARIVPGIVVRGGFLSMLWLAIIFSVVNLIVGPVVKILSLPFIIVTLGLFLLVVNAALFGITAALSSHLNINGFWPAVLGGTIVAIFSWIAEQVLPIRQREWERRRRW